MRANLGGPPGPKWATIPFVALSTSASSGDDFALFVLITFYQYYYSSLYQRLCCMISLLHTVTLAIVEVVMGTIIFRHLLLVIQFVIQFVT